MSANDWVTAVKAANILSRAYNRKVSHRKVVFKGKTGYILRFVDDTPHNFDPSKPQYGDIVGPVSAKALLDYAKKFEALEKSTTAATERRISYPWGWDKSQMQSRAFYMLVSAIATPEHLDNCDVTTRLHADGFEVSIRFTVLQSKIKREIHISYNHGVRRTQVELLGGGIRLLGYSSTGGFKGIPDMLKARTAFAQYLNDIVKTCRDFDNFGTATTAGVVTARTMAEETLNPTRENPRQKPIDTSKKFPIGTHVLHESGVTGVVVKHNPNDYAAPTVPNSPDRLQAGWRCVKTQAGTRYLHISRLVEE